VLTVFIAINSLLLRALEKKARGFFGLVELLEESKILFEPNADSSEVERVLKEHGDKLALPLVAQQLTRKSPSVHLRALEILKKRKGAGHAAEIILHCFPHANANVRVKAVDALKSFGSDAVPALVKTGLAHEDKRVRLAVLKVLESLGVGAAGVIAEHGLAHEDNAMRIAALQALQSLGSGAAEQASKVVENCLNSKNPLLQKAALGALKAFGSKAVPFAEKPLLKLFGGKIFFSRQKRSLALRAAASMNAEFKKVGGKLRLVPLAG